MFSGDIYISNPLPLLSQHVLVSEDVFIGQHLGRASDSGFRVRGRVSGVGSAICRV